jgi:hypothetical protein
MVAEPRPSDVAALRAAIISTGRVRIPGDDVWALWCRAVPRLSGSADQLQVLSRSLEVLAGDEVVELPSSPQSRMTAVRLPRFVTVPSARRGGRDQPWRSYPWLRRLGWISSLSHVGDELFDDLVAINAWIAEVGERTIPIVPVRYRSAEIFDREKRLDELSTSRLFGPDRLSFDLLACRRVAPPLAAAIVGTGSDVLVVENSDTYWVVQDALRAVDGHRIGVVAWGSGRSFPSQVESLGIDVAGRGPVRGTVWYWGDLDPIGIEIAIAASLASTAIAVEPAEELWTAMAHVDVQGVGDHDWGRVDGATWLSDEIWARLRHVRASQGRVAQERVPVDVITRWASRYSG